MVLSQSRTAFIFGCGYLGMRVARHLLADRWRVLALTRSPDRARSLSAVGVEPLVGDWTDARVIAKIPPAARVLVSVGYDALTRQSRDEVYVEGLRRALPAMPAAAQVVYISTTGVYHQGGGVWVDERSPARPRREGGLAHLRAEQLLVRQRGSGGPFDGTVVLRMAGLYGPGRVPRSDSVRGGEPLRADPQHYLNLIHIEDAARCVMAAWEHPNPQALYVVADGRPVMRADFYREVARLLKVAEPQFQTAATGALGSGRSDSNKRIWAARVRRDLLPRLDYPSYREGLRAILRSRS